jgi:hypothetical protein
MDQATQQNAALVEEMAAAASSLKSQANDLVQVVAGFNLGGSGHSQSPSKAAVRSTVPKAAPFKGQERRDAGIPKGAAARAPAAMKTTQTPISMAARLGKPTPVASAKVTPAGGDDDWETF